MLKSYRAISFACSSLSRQLISRPLSVSGALSVDKEPRKEDVEELFSEKKERSGRPPRRSFSMNRVELIGGVGTDPVVRTARNGREFVSLLVITNRVERTASGEMVDFGTEAHPVTLFNGVDRAMRFLRKGKRVYISGRLHYTQTTSPDGLVYNRANIFPDVIQPLESMRNFESFDDESQRDAHDEVEREAEGTAAETRK